jgi:hypothetical protein
MKIPSHQWGAGSSPARGTKMPDIQINNTVTKPASLEDVAFWTGNCFVGRQTFT